MSNASLTAAMTSAAQEAVAMMTAARVSLLLGNPNPQPFFGPLAMSLKLVSDPSCKTAWVDGSRIGFNPGFVRNLRHAIRVTLVAHEVLHPALGDPWRRGDRDHRRWNIACDKRINRLLLDSGFELPENVYIAEGDEIGKSAEWIYANDLEEESKRKAQEPQPEPPTNPKPEEDEESGEGGSEGDDESEDEEDGDGDGDGSGDGDEDAEDGEGEGSGEGDDAEEGDGSGKGKGSGKGEGDSEGEGEGSGDGDGQGDGTGSGEGSGDEDDDNPFGEVRDAQTGPNEDGEESPSEEDWRQKTAVAAANAKGQGSLPGGMARAIEDALAPEVDTRGLLVKFFQEAAPNDYSWTRPSRRYMAQGMYLPSLFDKQLGEVALMIDTSGSINGVALREARTIVQSVIDECKPSKVSVYYADARVCRVDHFEQGDELVWQPQGGGGTDFRPALAAIEQDETPVCVVCITDLEGTFPEIPPSIPVLWLSTKRRNWRGDVMTAPFGDTVYVGR